MPRWKSWNRTWTRHNRGSAERQVSLWAVEDNHEAVNSTYDPLDEKSWPVTCTGLEVRPGRNSSSTNAWEQGGLKQEGESSCCLGRPADLSLLIRQEGIAGGEDGYTRGHNP